MLGLFGFALTAAYFPSWIGGEIAGAAQVGRWTVLALALGSLFFLGPIRVTFAHIVGWLFVVYAAVSLAWSPTWYDSVGSLLPLAITAGIFMVGGQIKDLRLFYIGAALGLIPSSIICIYDINASIATGGIWDINLIGSDAQHRFSQQWGGGLFVNPLFLAEPAVLCALPTILALVRKPAQPWTWALLVWISPCIVVPAIVSARGPVLALAVCTLICLWPAHRRLTLWCGAVGIGLLAVAIYARPGTVDDRIWLWIDTARAVTWLGHGYGSFFGLFPEYAHHLSGLLTRHDDPHNLILKTAFELGPIGVILLGAFFWILLYGPLTVERLVLTGFLIESLFAFPEHLPATAGMAALVAGRIARSLPDWRDAMEQGGTCIRDQHGNQVDTTVD
jgi:hypothetical protein